MSFDPVHIGVIGTGRFGILHAKTLLGLAESELVALVDCSDKVLAELPEEFSGIPKYSALEDALRNLRQKPGWFPLQLRNMSRLPPSSWNRMLMSCWKNPFLETSRML